MKEPSNTIANEPILFANIFITNLSHCPCSNSNNVSAAKLEKVVNAPKNPVKKNKRQYISALKRPTSKAKKKPAKKEPRVFTIKVP